MNGTRGHVSAPLSAYLRMAFLLLGLHLRQHRDCTLAGVEAVSRAAVISLGVTASFLPRISAKPGTWPCRPSGTELQQARSTRRSAGTLTPTKAARVKNIFSPPDFCFHKTAGSRTYPVNYIACRRRRPGWMLAA